MTEAASPPTWPAKNALSTAGKRLGSGKPVGDSEERTNRPRATRPPAVRSEIFAVAATSFVADANPCL